MNEQERRAGSGPYREGPVTPPTAPSRPAVAMGFGGAIAAVNVVRLLFAGARGMPPPASHLPAEPAPIERASSLAGGARVLAVFADRDARHPAVLRVPGEARRRGSDTVVTPETLAGNGAVAALADGEHLRAADGELLRVQRGEVRALPGAEVMPWGGRGEQVVERAGDFARLSDGALFAVRSSPAGPLLAAASAASITTLATDGTTVCVALDTGSVRCAPTATRYLADGPKAPAVGHSLGWIDVALAVPGVAQLAVRGEVACARGEGGEVACARVPPGGGGPLPLSGDVPRATAIALGNHDLCLLAPDRRLHCVHGPQSDATAPLLDAPLLDAPLPLHVAMANVDEVGLTDGVGCARSGGRVACWGPLARGGWVTRRDRPVQVDGLRDVTALTTIDGYVCARTDGGIACWGVGVHGVPEATPAPVAVERPAAAGPGSLANAYTGLRVDGRRCAPCYLLNGCSNSRPHLRPCPLTDRLVRTAASERPVEYPGNLACAVEADSSVTCGEVPRRSADAPTSRERVPDLRDVTRVVVTGQGLACALRRDGTVWCWGDNRSGVLTAREAARAAHRDAHALKRSARRATTMHTDPRPTPWRTAVLLGDADRCADTIDALREAFDDRPVSRLGSPALGG